MRDTQRGRDTGRGRSRRREPDAGLDPETPGSHPEPKADAQPWSHPGVPTFPLFKNLIIYIIRLHMKIEGHSTC